MVLANDVINSRNLTAVFLHFTNIHFALEIGSAMIGVHGFNVSGKQSSGRHKQVAAQSLLSLDIPCALISFETTLVGQLLSATACSHPDA